MMKPTGLLLFLSLALSGCAAPDAKTDQAPIRCAVIGGMMDSGLWQAVSERFEKATGQRVVVVAHGQKDRLAQAFLEEDADLVTMHASDAILNLVADGHAVDAQPWARNDLLLVGPPDDPAGIRDLKDGAEALRRIAKAKAPFVLHSSLGAQEVLRTLMGDGEISLDPANTTMLLEPRARDVLQTAWAKKAYTLVGRIPFLDGRMPNPGLQVLARGDARMRRPYLVAVANPKRISASRYAAAKKLAAFLRSPETQAWLAEYGKGKLDAQPLFFPVAVD